MIRAGVTRLILAKELVPGDVVFIKQGDKVPADLRVFYCTNLKVDRSSVLPNETNPFHLSSTSTSLSSSLPL